jgi:hypothetical protein
MLADWDIPPPLRGYDLFTTAGFGRIIALVATETKTMVGRREFRDVPRSWSFAT